MDKGLMFNKGSSINDVTPEEEGGGVPQKVTKGDKGEVPCFNQRWRHPNVYFQNTYHCFKLIIPLQNLVLKLDLGLGLMVQNGVVYVTLGIMLA